jgi:hypothetical protein
VAGNAEERHSSDRHATLAISNVATKSGDLAGITVRYSGPRLSNGRQDVPLAQDRTTTDYGTTISGLTNGTEYTFTVEVCNTVGKCATSAPVTFAPYGSPQVVAPVLTSVGQIFTVTTKPVVRNANPGTTTCTVKVTGTPVDAAAPAEQSVDPGGDSFKFTAKAATSYVATQTCTTAGVLDGSVTSPPLSSGAV